MRVTAVRKRGDIAMFFSPRKSQSRVPKTILRPYLPDYFGFDCFRILKEHEHIQLTKGTPFIVGHLPPRLNVSDDPTARLFTLLQQKNSRDYGAVAQYA
jgi:hypothetical protein